MINVYHTSPFLLHFALQCLSEIASKMAKVHQNHRALLSHRQDCLRERSVRITQARIRKNTADTKDREVITMGSCYQVVHFNYLL